MREALPKNDPSYGSVQDIDGRLYVGGAGPEAKRAREREEAKARQAAQRAAAEEAERQRREAAVAKHGPLVDAWPAVRAELSRRRDAARERLVAELAVAPGFGAFLELLAAEEAVDRGAREVSAARSEIDRRPASSMRGRRSDLLAMVAELARDASQSMLEEARASEKGS